MIYTEELKAMQTQAIRRVQMKLKQAQRGHDFVVLGTPIDEFHLIELTSELLNFRRKFGEFAGIDREENNAVQMEGDQE